MDKKDAFEKYIIGDLTSNGFKLVSSRFINNKPPIPVSGYKQAIRYAAGGMRMGEFAGYKIFRTVVIKDHLDMQHEVLAAIEFDDRSLFRCFKSLSWTPELKTLVPINKLIALFKGLQPNSGIFVRVIFVVKTDFYFLGFCNTKHDIFAFRHSFLKIFKNR